MTDFLGKELSIGDKVVYCRHNGTSTSLIKAVITKIMNQKVRIGYDSYYTGTIYEYAVYPDKLVKITE